VNPIQKQFVTAVLHRCVDLGWNAKQLCQQAQISESGWSEVRSGRKSPTLLMMSRIATAVGVEFHLSLEKPSPQWDGGPECA
jgi:transcriptional regulator with XRE-family HTH domain